MERVRLGDICEKITKGTTPSSIGFNFVDKGINFIKIESIEKDGTFDKNKFSYINEECNNRMQRSQLKDGDILFSIAGALGRIAIVNDDVLPANINQAIAIIRLKDKKKYNKKYISYVLRSSIVEKQVNNQKQGVAQLNLSLQNINDLHITVCDMQTQQKIVEELDKINEIIDKKKQQIADLDVLIKSKFIEMFGNENHTEKMINLCKFINGDRSKNYPSGNDRVDFGVPFINAGHLNNNVVCFDDMDYITEEKYESLSSGKIEKNDIIYCLRGSIGKKGIVTFDKGAIASSLLILRANEKIRSLFLLYTLEQEYIIAQMEASNNGSSQPNLSAQSVKQYDVILPELNKQIEFERFVEQIDKSKFNIQQSIDELETLLASRMQCYFGEN